MQDFSTVHDRSWRSVGKFHDFYAMCFWVSTVSPLLGLSWAFYFTTSTQTWGCVQDRPSARTARSEKYACHWTVWWFEMVWVLCFWIIWVKPPSRQLDILIIFKRQKWFALARSRRHRSGGIQYASPVFFQTRTGSETEVHENIDALGRFCWLQVGYNYIKIDWVCVLAMRLRLEKGLLSHRCDVW